ncbi:MAG: hypothetical protein PVH28_09005 [Desulfobacterales bacterium]|jgi:hypothetical protein
MPQKEENAYIHKDSEALTDLWLKANNYREREGILKELERRRAIDQLIFCFEIAGWQTRPEQERKRDRLYILNIFGKLKDQKRFRCLPIS